MEHVYNWQEKFTFQFIHSNLAIMKRKELQVGYNTENNFFSLTKEKFSFQGNMSTY